MNIIGKAEWAYQDGSTAFYTDIDAESRLGKVFYFEGKKYKVTQWKPLVIDYDKSGNPIGRYFIAKEVFEAGK